MPAKTKRCKTNTRKCFFTRKCHAKSSVKRSKRCASGHRQCADRKCYRKRVATRASTRRK